MDTIFIFSTDEFLIIVARTTTIFLVAFLTLRFLGRRRLAHLTFIDVLLIVALGSAVGDVMIYGETTAHFLASATAIVVVGVFVKIFEELASRYELMHKIVIGNAVPLVDGGKIVESSLQKNDIRQEDLMAMLRSKGVHDLKRVDRVWLEYDGEISIVRKRSNGARKKT